MGRTLGSGPALWPGTVPFHLGRVGLVLVGDEVGIEPGLMLYLLLVGATSAWRSPISSTH